MPSQENSFRLSFRGRRLVVQLIRRPFREGLEARVELDGHVIRVAEQGLGKVALRQKLRFELERVFAQRRKVE